ncbi:Smr/MutS family protein [uncultured Pseudodesulfovibrio sp.]|uniref:Smr/MutS family protein n=1 Tax=uncultured Pseudodesulfovibrio sp. TaxID=2035858 RepID=UPI0029C90FF0|nr:Smr/MutS family protein [uncultured Pseudodesulfovibrio sp.]
MSKKKRIKSLSDLASLGPKKEKKDAYALPYKKKASPKQTEEEAAPPPDEEIFMAAMQGVKQINSPGGRQVTPQPAPKATATPLEDDAENDLKRFMRGDVEFELEYTDEFMYGYVRGLDIKTFQQLKAGSLSVAAHLDLHGMTSDQAHESLLFFIRESYLQGHRCVLVVTGRGINSPGGQSILRRETETWLTRDPLKRVTLAFCTAQPKDGGAGAIYVLLRKQKKTQGKISWDKVFNWDEKPE